MNILKIALNKKQVESKNKIREFDGYEIQLLGNDDYSLVPKLSKPIRTIHAPFYLSDIYTFADDPTGESDRILELCYKFNAGLVLHMEQSLREVNDTMRVLCKKLRDKHITVHLENCEAEAYSFDCLALVSMLKKQGVDIYPLLDTCHLQMAQLSFKYTEMNFKDAIEKFASDNYVIHLSDAIGCGHFDKGGFHGSHFEYNKPLLENILRELKHYKADIVFEVYEKDPSEPLNAIKLLKDVEEIKLTI